MYYYRFIFSLFIVLLVVGCGITGITENTEKDTENAEGIAEATVEPIHESALLNTSAASVSNAPEVTEEIVETVENDNADLPTATNDVTVELVVRPTVEQESEPKPVTETTQITVTLQVAGAGVEFKHDVTVDDGATVDTVMRKAKAKHNLAYGTSDFGGMGVFVDAIGGVKSNDQVGMYWILSVNGKKSTVGVSSKTVHAGDVIRWVYEKAF